MEIASKRFRQVSWSFDSRNVETSVWVEVSVHHNSLDISYVFRSSKSLARQRTLRSPTCQRALMSSARMSLGRRRYLRPLARPYISAHPSALKSSISWSESF
ncbi:hypothetical protein ABFX02_04G155350 [Erythranthe guttata]